MGCEGKWLKDLRESGLLALFKQYADMAQGEMPFMLLLEDNPGGIPQVEIAKALSISKPRATALLAKLELRGWARRGNIAKRNCPVFLTEKGKEALGGMKKKLNEVRERLIAPLTQEEREEGLRLLAKIAEGNRKCSN